MASPPSPSPLAPETTQIQNQIGTATISATGQIISKTGIFTTENSSPSSPSTDLTTIYSMLLETGAILAASSKDMAISEEGHEGEKLRRLTVAFDNRAYAATICQGEIFVVCKEKRT